MTRLAPAARVAGLVAAALVGSAAFAACGVDDRSPDRSAPQHLTTSPGGTAGETLATGSLATGFLAAAWESGPAAPLALTEVAAAVHDGRIWVAGGLDRTGQAVDAVLVFDPVTSSWSDGPALPEPVHHAALVSDGFALRLVGGYAGSGFDRPTGAVLVLQGDGWTPDRPLPEPRAAGAAAWNGAGLVVYAGGVGPGGVSDAVFGQFDHGWQPLGRLSEPREHLAATSDGEGRVFVLGGRRGGLDGNRPSVDVVEERQTRRLGELPTPRGGVAAFFWPSLGACLAGGESPGGAHAEVECITADREVTRLPELGVARHGLGAAVLDGVAYTLLGGPQPGLFVSDVVERLALP